MLYKKILYITFVLFTETTTDIKPMQDEVKQPQGDGMDDELKSFLSVSKQST